jgi:hypothetical protein
MIEMQAIGIYSRHLLPAEYRQRKCEPKMV